MLVGYHYKGRAGAKTTEIQEITKKSMVYFHLKFKLWKLVPFWRES